MSNHKLIHSKWAYIIGGLMIGIILSIGLNITTNSVAQSDTTADLKADVRVSGSTDDDLAVAEHLSNAFAAVAQKVNPSVVMIFTESTIKGQAQPFASGPFEQFFGDDFFSRFFNQLSPQGEFKQRGLGSGVIIDSDGIILTNNHVVRNAENILVRLIDGREFKAEVKGTDEQTDLAVISIEASGLTPVKFGDSDRARVGDWVLAIGSPLQPELEHTVTAGIVSAKGRSGVGLSQYEDFIQTDAAINPGNSGGAMVNLRGELIGINAAIATQNGGFMGIGFAIPVNLAKKVTADILEKGKVIRGWLGVYIQTVTPEIAKALNLEKARGVIISKVQKDSPAEKAGLQEQDVVIRFNGKEVANSSKLSTWIAGTSPDADIELTVIRNEKVKTIDVQLGELTPEKQQAGLENNQFPKLGLTLSNITNEQRKQYNLSEHTKGVVITSINPQGLAASYALREGDVIVKLNQQPVENVAQFRSVLDAVEQGSTLLFYIQRGNANLFVAFPLP